MSEKNIYTTKHLSRISERTTIWLYWVNAFTATKPVKKANLLSICNLLLQRVDGTKALDREGEKKSSSILNKMGFSFSEQLSIWVFTNIALRHPPALCYGSVITAFPYFHLHRKWK